MAHLPTEVVWNILDHLSVADRQSASLTCKQWNYAANRARYHREEEIQLVSPCVSTFLQVLADMEPSDRSLFSIKVTRAEITREVSDFWHFFAPKLISLKLVECNINEPCFVEILHECTVLEELEVIDCPRLFVSFSLYKNDAEMEDLRQRLRRVHRLNLYQNTYLRDNLLCQFFNVLPSIRSLNVGNSSMQFHPAIHRRFYPNSFDPSIGSDAVITFECLVHCLKEKASQIKRLDLSGTFITNKALAEVSEIEGLELEELGLIACVELTARGLIDLVEHQRLLKCLKFSHIRGVNDARFEHICSGLVDSLERLEVHGLPEIRGEALESFWKLEKLKTLSFEISSSLSQNATSSLIKKLPTCLTSLTLIGAPMITAGNIRRLSGSLPNLDSLTLNCGHYVDISEAIQEALPFLTRLRSLSILSCMSLTDSALTRQDPRSEEPDPHSILSMKGLRHLTLKDCYNLTDITLLLGIKFRELKYLCLSGNGNFSRIGLNSVAHNNPSLEIIKLVDCNNLGAKSIISAMGVLPRLSRVHLDAQNIRSINRAMSSPSFKRSPEFASIACKCRHGAPLSTQEPVDVEAVKTYVLRRLIKER